MNNERAVTFFSTRCPDCGCKRSRVYKTRYYKSLAEVRRLHKCKYCGRKFMSVEVLDDGEDFPILTPAQIVG